MRALVHMGAGGMCLMLAWLPAAAAIAIAVLFVGFNLWILPRLAGGRLRRSDTAWGPSDRGLVLYPLCVLALLLLLPDRPCVVACAWALLAFGDGAASLAGRSLGGPRLPWNGSKSLTGSVAFVAGGGSAVCLLLSLAARGVLPFRDAPLLEPGLPAGGWLAVSFAAALVAAVVESLPGGLDDNLTVPWAGAAALLGLLTIGPASLHAGLRQAVDLYPSVLAVTLVAGITAYLLDAVSLSGLIGGVGVGTLIGVGVGWPGLALLGAFFVLGSATTRLGLAAKQARGIAEGNAGARSAAQTLAKGTVPALCALFALIGLERSACAFAFAGAVAAAAFDTAASEVGKWLGGPTIVPGSPRLVAPGTAGGVSLAGTLGGAAAAAAVATLAVGSGLTPGGWTAGWILWIAAAAGSFSERPLALLGAGGRAHPAALNLFNTLVGAATALALAQRLLPRIWSGS